MSTGQAGVWWALIRTSTLGGRVLVSSLLTPLEPPGHWWKIDFILLSLHYFKNIESDKAHLYFNTCGVTAYITMHHLVLVPGLYE